MICLCSVVIVTVVDSSANFSQKCKTPFIPSHCVIPSEVTTVGGTKGNPRRSTSVSIIVQSKTRFVDPGVYHRSLGIKSQKQEESKAVDPHGGERELRVG